MVGRSEAPALVARQETRSHVMDVPCRSPLAVPAALVARLLSPRLFPLLLSTALLGCQGNGERGTRRSGGGLRECEAREEACEDCDGARGLLDR